MNELTWQDLFAFGLVLWASGHVAQRVWQALRPSRGARGCSGCAGCPNPPAQLPDKPFVPLAQLLPSRRK